MAESNVVADVERRVLRGQSRQNRACFENGLEHSAHRGGNLHQPAEATERFVCQISLLIGSLCDRNLSVPCPV